MICVMSIHCRICIFGKPWDTLGFRHMASVDIIISSHLFMCYMASFAALEALSSIFFWHVDILMSLSLSDNKHLYVCTWEASPLLDRTLKLGRMWEYSLSLSLWIKSCLGKRRHRGHANILKTYSKNSNNWKTQPMVLKVVLKWGVEARGSKVWLGHKWT